VLSAYAVALGLPAARLAQKADVDEHALHHRARDCSAAPLTFARGGNYQSVSAA
jgi:hypothetical protein